MINFVIWQSCNVLGHNLHDVKMQGWKKTGTACHVSNLFLQRALQEEEEIFVK
jgi:hypothetical protein